ncbi:MAG: hypothetical protein V1936_02610 [Patescibacteria group bacterium]
MDNPETSQTEQLDKQAIRFFYRWNKESGDWEIIPIRSEVTLDYFRSLSDQGWREALGAGVPVKVAETIAQIKAAQELQLSVTKKTTTTKN